MVVVPSLRSRRDGTCELTFVKRKDFLRFLRTQMLGACMPAALSKVNLALPHDERSQIIGTSRETVSRATAEFCRKPFAILKSFTRTIQNEPAAE